MTYTDFCQFCGSFIDHILEMRIVRIYGMKDRYSILIRLGSQDSADRFFKHFNFSQFSSLQEEVCRVYFTENVHYRTGSIEHSQESPASSTDQPTCVVGLGMFFYF
ncbi:BRAP2 RING ZnF UBP domain-containing protein 2-like [Humulus lupulus]|uniref:BRAP2 RING ZnF UBP domain-containing protein 2-like n=1 Tax=Humulus lupulus TaxID=3486 RepID=UPI002B415C59|nr:BRAP2 RING ZnF UBP domain-containing protein 2-like [Humulus lupulus]